MRGLIGKKIGMTQIIAENGEMIPVTLLDIGPCTVTQVKTVKKDGYEAVQIGFGERKEKHTTQPMAGHFKKAGTSGKKVVAEFEKVSGFDYQVGQVFTCSLFKPGDRIDVTGTSKGHGFTGVIKRHNFHRQNVTHGQSEYLRHPGSIGQASDPSRVFKGMKMAGHHGNVKVTIRNLQVVQIDDEKNQVMVRGAVPGANNGIVYIKK